MKRFYESAKIATQYAKYRPTYPSEIADCVISYCNQQTDEIPFKFDLMVDVGCGSGQSTNVFQPYFKEIIGIDVSAEQLKQARKRNKFDNIRYCEGSAESIPVEDHSVDLVLAGAAAHWFDLPKFFEEVKRVLKPDTGCLVMIGYHAPELRVISNPDPVRAAKSQQLLKSWIEKFAENQTQILSGIQQCHKRYKDIFDAIPFTTKIRNDDFHLRYKSSLFEICQWFSSMEFYESYMEKTVRKLKNNNIPISEETLAKFDPLCQICDKILNLWDLKSCSVYDDLNFEVDYCYFMLLASHKTDDYRCKKAIINVL